MDVTGQQPLESATCMPLHLLDVPLHLLGLAWLGTVAKVGCAASPSLTGPDSLMHVRPLVRPSASTIGALLREACGPGPWSPCELVVQKQVQRLMCGQARLHGAAWQTAGLQAGGAEPTKRAVDVGTSMHAWPGRRAGGSRVGADDAVLCSLSSLRPPAWRWPRHRRPWPPPHAAAAPGR